MMTLKNVVDIIRSDHGGAWWYLFHEADGGFKFLPCPDVVLTSAAYDHVREAFGETVPRAPLSATQRRRNTLRARAEQATR